MRKYIGWPILFALFNVVRYDFYVVPIFTGLFLVVVAVGVNVWYRRRSAARREKQL
jgi:Flp pilus assembly protein TadB